MKNTNRYKNKTPLTSNKQYIDWCILNERDTHSLTVKKEWHEFKNLMRSF
jgi:hypothetical protein